MLDTDDLALWYALNRLMTNYWAEVDHNGGSRAHEFYLPEALFAVGNNRFEGPEKIRDFGGRPRSLSAVFRLQLGLALVRPDRRARFGALPHSLLLFRTGKGFGGRRSPADWPGHRDRRRLRSGWEAGRGCAPTSVAAPNSPR